MYSRGRVRKTYEGEDQSFFVWLSGGIWMFSVPAQGDLDFSARPTSWSVFSSETVVDSLTVGEDDV